MKLNMVTIAVSARSTNRAIAACASAGTVSLIVGTYLHPVPEDPNDAVNAFTRYAADRLWVSSHLLQLAGIILMLTALILLATEHRRVRGAIYYRIGAAGAIACLAAAMALQAVDGIALKHAVDAWSAAPAVKRDAAFYAAFAIRQIEVGLASIVSILLGVTAALYGLAMFCDDAFPNWVAGLAGLAGMATTIAGIVMAYSGFSGLQMLISMPANSLLLLWMLIIGVVVWRTNR
jgi:hypothetical protein